MKETVLLLTACINPNGMKYTELNDPSERERQYVRAVKFYIDRTKYKVCFCENSNSDLSAFEKIDAGGRLELLSFDGNGYNPNLGKGYGEYRIIEYAFAHSRFIQEASCVVKITGRLMIDNLSQIEWLNKLLLRSPRDYVYVSPSEGNTKDSRCIMAPKWFYTDHFLARENNINDTNNYWFEHFLYDVVQELPERYVVSDYVIPLSVAGASASWGETYNNQATSFAGILQAIRNFCQSNKSFYQAKDKRVYYRMSWMSVCVWVIKAVAVRFGRLNHKR